jgi:hypothetical protein
MLITVRASRALTWAVLFMGIGAGLGYQGNREMAARWEAEADRATAAVVEARKQVAESQALVGKANLQIAELQRRVTSDERREQGGWRAVAAVLGDVALGMALIAALDYGPRRLSTKVDNRWPSTVSVQKSSEDEGLASRLSSLDSWTPQQWNSFLKEARLVRRS